MHYDVANDGTGDQTANLQKAIDDTGTGDSRKGHGVTRFPAEVYLPSGVYQLGSTLKLTVGTIIVGNPNNPPVIKASPSFRGQFLVLGYDKNNGNPETSFMMVMKNVILDTTSVDANVAITALQWGVAQGSGLTNVEVRMPTGPGTHTGIDLNAGSTIAVTDVVSFSPVTKSRCRSQLTSTAHHRRCHRYQKLESTGQFQKHPLYRGWHSLLCRWRMDCAAPGCDF
jgi:hypothetical protein